MVNEVHLIGNLGDDVKLHYFEGGGCVGRFPLATSRHWKNKDGEKQSKTNWHNVVVRNTTAENAEKYLSKGSKVYVGGSIEYTQWQGEDGETKYGTEIWANRLKFLDSKGEGESTRRPERPITETHAGDDFLSGNTSSSPAGNTPETNGEEDDDLPF